MRSGVLLAVLLVLPKLALAEEADASTDDAEPAETEGSENEDEEEENPNRFELAPFPALGGNTDIGFSFGVDGRLSRLEEGYSPYRYSIHLNASLSVKRHPDGGAELPKHDYALDVDFPGLLNGLLRVAARGGFGRIVNAGWYGLSGLSDPDPLSRLDLADLLDEEGISGRRYQWVNMSAFGGVDLRWHFSDDMPIELLTGFTFRYMMPQDYGISLLTEDLRQQFDDGATVLEGFQWHPLFQVRVGMLWDRRDHEIAPTRGTYSEVSWRGSLGFPEDGTLTYMGVTADFRLFVPLIDRQRLVFASRVLFDMQFGDVPFYELPLVGAFSPNDFCGGELIRAAPSGRRAGVGKLVGAAELRSLFAPFRLFGMNMVFGLLFFVTVGHLWTTLDPEPPFEGLARASTWGAGMGLLLRWGETIMVRIEAGYSPDATDAGMPVGIYFTLGYAF